MMPSETTVQAPLDPTPALPPASRTLYWSVRRELWESRSVYLAPLAVAALVLLASSISVLAVPHKLQAVAAHEVAKQHAVLVRPFRMAPAPIMLVTFVVGIFYALDALYGERRDRSILFWKSLPVSDLTTVLSKASIPLLVLPLIGFVVGLATQVGLLLLGSAVLSAAGLDPGRLWTELHFFRGVPIMLYGMLVHALWFAPIYAWLLLVSAWAQRTPVLWAVLPPFVLVIAERIVLGTSYVGAWLRYRVTGAMAEAFGGAAERGASRMADRFSVLDPLRFLASPGLWLGLLAAATFLAAAAWLRRSRDPI